MSSTANVRTKSLKLKLLPAGDEGAKDQVTKFTNPNFRLVESRMQNMGDQLLKSVKITLT